MIQFSVEDILQPSYAVATGEHAMWKVHTEAIVKRHHGRTLEQVVEDIAVNLARAAIRTGVSVQQLAHETVPFYMALLMWGRAGRPHFSLTPDFFKSILLTDFGDPTDEPLYMPFDSFTVSFPPSPAFGVATRAFVYKAPQVLAVEGHLQTTWPYYRATLVLGSDPIFTQWPVGMTRRQLLEPNSILDKPAGDLATRPLDTGESELTRKLRFLLCNVFSYIEAAGPLPVAVHHSLTRAPVERIHPVQPLYDVGRVVKLSPQMREALKLSESNGGTSRSLIHRFIVRGHWRNQSYGEARALRRRQWIDPFWKGPTDVVEALSKTYEVG